ncbi:CDP-glucose 4,6-dehydratase [Hirschia baltica]|uniref:CDP-glucose 4,6-dehydratase n=1 Tax=Hirschia baltica (strain ATCC 49814 / DSM 5838 / IFAM 1418) TaxID=582402 RepID=C6XLY9_HIRBI|nr:CDP-glucose 4,6-dehydratase [Hirschia baltica]ACT59821.1 CDP-glucose 4,6-dehydratase [Hirschia baltica ATCC 49814]
MFDYVRGNKVLVTGHTGFCGSWLSLWLNKLGADVHGLSLAPYTTPNMHSLVDFWTDKNSHIGDISSPGVVKAALDASGAEIIYHLAAQPLVRQSYHDPLETYRSNVIGTAELLEAVRHSDTVKAVVLVTTDKVYHNNEWIHPYRESDRLGGKDPYSASKAACELVIHSYLDTILDKEKVLCASARGGNIIGGGDWSTDRLIPDIVRALETDKPLEIRNPAATRPWQHVLALCHGYLSLGEKLYNGDKTMSGSWNFGPIGDMAITTLQIVDAFGEHWKKPPVDIQGSPLHEAQLLALDSTKARHFLKWGPAWSTDEGIAKTVEWYKAHSEGKDMKAFSMQQIEAYQAGIC